MKSSAVSILTRSLSSNHIMRPSVSASEELSRKLFDRIEADSPYGSFSVANCPRNHNLNRWCNVLPFDNTRIKLCPTGILNFLRWQWSLTLNLKGLFKRKTNQKNAIFFKSLHFTLRK